MEVGCACRCRGRKITYHVNLINTVVHVLLSGRNQCIAKQLMSILLEINCLCKSTEHPLLTAALVYLSTYCCVELTFLFVLPYLCFSWFSTASIAISIFSDLQWWSVSMVWGGMGTEFRLSNVWHHGHPGIFFVTATQFIRQGCSHGCCHKHRSF